jgi:hypothetical protein
MPKKRITFMGTPETGTLPPAGARGGKRRGHAHKISGSPQGIVQRGFTDSAPLPRAEMVQTFRVRIKKGSRRHSALRRLQKRRAHSRSLFGKKIAKFVPLPEPGPVLNAPPRARAWNGRYARRR